MSDLEDRLAEALRCARQFLSTHTSLGTDPEGIAYQAATQALAEYDAAHRQPDAAERAARRICDGHTNCKCSSQTIIREEIARDNAERDAMDREREEAVQAFLRSNLCYHGDMREREKRVRRAFGWDK